jgi:ComF family protein
MAATHVPQSPTTRWRAVVRVLRSPLDSLSCTLFPSSCALCGSFLPRLSLVPICDVCWTEFPLQAPPTCLRCGDALSTVPATGISASCRACRLAPPPFARAVSYGVYQGRMREAIHALKYERLHPAAAGLGRMLAAAIAQLSDVAPAEMLVIPVPLHPSKYAQRGFNQSRSLTTQALRFLRKSHPQWRLTLASSTLLRQRATDSQAGLTPRQRRLNVRGAFLVSHAARVKGQHVLIVDDILTTGATARAAARVLVEAGAASVWVATLARAQRVTRFGSTSVYENMEEEEPLAGASSADLGTADFDAASFSRNGPTLHEHPSF